MAYTNGTFRGLSASGTFPVGVCRVKTRKTKLPGNDSKRKIAKELMQKLSDPHISKKEKSKIKRKLENMIV